MQPELKKLVVHYFKYMKGGEEVFLSGNLLMVKVYAIVAGLELEYVREFFPEKIPSAFVDGVELDLEDVLDVLREMKELEIDTEISASSLWIKKELSDILEFNLFMNRDCFDKFTSPLFYASMPRPAADFFLLKKRVLPPFPESSESTMIKRFETLLNNIHEFLGNRKFPDNPNFLDITLYAFLSPLFAIPPDLTFWEKQQFPLNRVRAFLLDFDDWLWSHAIKPTLLSGIPKLPSHLKEVGNSGKSEIEGESELDATAVLTPEAKKQNWLFAGFCVFSVSLALLVPSL